MPQISTIVLASGNAGKLREFNQLFQPLGYELKPQSEWGVSAAEELHHTFVENALTKARHASRATGQPALADDSGLCANALGGMPGVHSARFAEIHAQGNGDEANNDLLLHKMQGVSDRTACFVAALVFVRHAEDPLPLIAQGIWWGEIARQPAGSNGFGYDPIFWLPKLQCTAAQLSAAQKNSLSHRARALQQLIQQIHEIPH